MRNREVHNEIQTCPRDAAATGSGDISEKSSSIVNPSSCSIVLKATLEENGVIRSCSSESSSRYDGGIKSYNKAKLDCDNITLQDVNQIQCRNRCSKQRYQKRTKKSNSMIIFM